MKVTYTTENARIRFEFEVSSGKVAFEMIGKIQDIFEESACGCCSSPLVRCSTREHDGNTFYNLVCGACGAQLDIGQRKDGKGMWLKRRDEDGNEKPNRGWYVYARGDRQQTNGSGARQVRQPARDPSEDVPF